MLKRKTITYLAALCCLLCTSCKNNRSARVYRADDSMFQVLTVDPNALSPKEMFKFSTIADTVEYIPLETNDSILVGNIKKLIVHNDVMYVWDDISESIFCYDTSGHFLYRVAARGHGPGEYARIRDFTLNFDNSNICILSDMDQSIFVYDSTGVFLEKRPMPFIASSVAVENDRIYAYTGRSPNEYPDLDKEHQFRLNVIENGEPKLRALPFTYKEDLLRVPLSSKNFSYYHDSLLLVEYLAPEIYTLDKDGQPVPRYRINFTTNTIQPRFEDPSIDREELKKASKSGDYTSLNSGFYETSHYIFFDYARGLIGGAYVDKRKNQVCNMGYFYLDDYNNKPLSPGILFVDENNLYLIQEAGILVAERNAKNLSPALDDQVKDMQETDNPTIVRIHLK